ncbi:hypothetical protein FZEAL_8126 [Fusarium zealandicum]|uniref:BAG domain-containing protein n=1 Tax=Fusarium zealandicum TaxID=1053134 RepID=A0A8H4XHU0_9HYPO|nr:hypothetical protein FZEAL_8126 [Fusarium zealandicum]
MSRYGWSVGREQLSPYSSIPGGVPAVTDDDFSYITSQDLDDTTDERYYSRSQSTAPPAPEDDVLLIKNRGITYPAHFPAYAIGDGKLRVIDVKDRVGLMMELPERGASRIKLLYKGKQLKDPLAPVRDYGVKNNSELMAVLPEIDDVSSASEEEMVIVDAPREDKKSRRRKKKRDKKKGITSDGDSMSASSPRDSASTFDHPRSPPAPPPSSGATSGPMKQLDDLSIEFHIKWLPLCTDYIEVPPSDPKKREEEHRKLSESIMQQIVLKLDGVESEGMADVRARRKELVRQVQKALKELDVAKDS